MKQNSIDWLFEQIPFEFTSSQAAFEALQIAKEMHKEEMSLFAENYHNYLQDNKKGVRGAMVSMSTEQYYNQTFNKDNQ